MKLLKNEKGIALVLVLVLSLVSLAMVASLIYIVTQGTRASGAFKRYDSAREAGHGGAEISEAYIANMGTLAITSIIGFSNGCNCADPLDFTDNIDLNLASAAESCRCNKLCNPTSDWGSICDEDTSTPAVVDISMDPNDPIPQVSADGKDAAEFRFALPGIGTDYNVSGKIVDTVMGNTDTSGTRLGGEGVVTATGGRIPAPLSPYLYRIEITSENQDNTRSKLSVLYAF